jgi:hypothetical protein
MNASEREYQARPCSLRFSENASEPASASAGRAAQCRRIGRLSNRLMPRPPLVRARYASRGHYAPTGGAYLFFCSCVAFTVALLTLSGFVLPERAVRSIGHQQAVEPILVATIQLAPDRQGVCRNLLFYNDSGRVDEGGFAPCRGLIPAEMLVETIRPGRREAFFKVFKFR